MTMQTPGRASTPASHLAGSSGVRFARRVYGIAGIYGVIVTVAGLFTEARFAEMIPPVIMHPELYYGFFAVTLTWQLAFLVIASDPARYRPLMWVTVLEKAGFVVAVAMLVGTGRSPRAALGLIVGDVILGALFAWSLQRTSSRGSS
jgi:hypothetical protein